MSELKRPEKYVEFVSIKPKFKDLTEFYTKKFQEYRQRILEFSEYADGLEKEISILKENSKVDVLLDNTDKQLVVVPKFVADSIESLYDVRSVYKAIRLILDKVEQPGDVNNDWIDTYDWLQERKNVEIFEKAWFCGYTVEKEKLFYVDFGFGIISYLNSSNDGDLRLYSKKQSRDVKTKFTEAEIKAIDVRYWSFAVPVDEVTEK